MKDGIKWSVVLACPGDDEVSLLADLSARRDARIVAVADPRGDALGTELARIMGLPVVSSLSTFDAPPETIVVHGQLRGDVAELVDQAEARGWETVRAPEFAARIASPLPPRPLGPAAEPAPDLQYLEQETAAIHRTLSRIEEALDRAALLRWLLGLAMRAAGAGSGSLLLLDEAAQELYVGFDHGLSESTRQRTRIPLGEGIAGRVAVSRRAERIRERGSDPRRDRPDIVDAVCAPIVWEDRLLGVLNLSASAQDGPLRDDALGLVAGLTHRLGLILERFLRLQQVQDRAAFRELDERLAGESLDTGDAVAGLRGRVGAFRSLSGAGMVELGLLTADGALCLVRPEEIVHATPISAEHAEVLTRGTARVVRGDDGVTTYHLPLKGSAERAVLSLGFTSAAAARDFGTRCADYVYLAGRHLGHGVDLAARGEELARVTALASSLSSLAEVRDEEGSRERALTAACRLTGAGRALLAEERESGAKEENDALIVAEARRLLAETGEQGWHATTLETGAKDDGPGRSVLVVPMEPHRPLPGLILLDKSRVHPLDAAVFTLTDAQHVRRLLPLIAQRPAPTVAAASAAPGDMLDRLRREMDRCDRYHTMLGVAAFRITRPAGAGEPLPTAAALGAQLRSSDEVGCLDDGTLVVIVPEDVQSLPRFQRRVGELLQALAGSAAAVTSGSAIYPGPAADAAQLLAAATRSLD